MAASLSIRGGRRGSEAVPAFSRVTVCKSDILLLGETGHLVLQVVPRDRKTGVIGWVEFSPEPIPRANCEKVSAKHGGRIIVPLDEIP